MNWKALLKAITPNAGFFYLMFGMLVFVGIATVLALALISGGWLALVYLFGESGASTASWVIIGAFWTWLLFGDVVADRYRKFSREES